MKFTAAEKARLRAKGEELGGLSEQTVWQLEQNQPEFLALIAKIRNLATKQDFLFLEKEIAKQSQLSAADIGKLQSHFKAIHSALRGLDTLLDLPNKVKDFENRFTQLQASIKEGVSEQDLACQISSLRDYISKELSQFLSCDYVTTNEFESSFTILSSNICALKSFVPEFF